MVTAFDIDKQQTQRALVIIQKTMIERMNMLLVEITKLTESIEENNKILKIIFEDDLNNEKNN